MAKRKLPGSWSDEHIQFLIDNHSTMPFKLIAENIGRSNGAVTAKAFVLGLKRTKQEQDLIHQKYNRGGFRKGHKSWNRGMKGLQIGGVATRFPKGNLPANTKEDGATSIRKDKRGVQYEFIRVAKAVWIPMQRYRWEQKHGPIPKGHILRCKDGNTLNTDPDNWYMIDRKINMEKNSGPVHLPDSYVAAMMTVRQPELRKELLKHPEVIEISRLNIKLKREINIQTAKLNQ